MRRGWSLFIRNEEWGVKSEERKEGMNEKKKEIEKRHLGAAEESAKKKSGFATPRAPEKERLSTGPTTTAGISSGGVQFLRHLLQSLGRPSYTNDIIENTRIVEALEAPQ